MSQINPKEFVHNTAYSVQLPYMAGLSLYTKNCKRNFKRPSTQKWQCPIPWNIYLINKMEDIVVFLDLKVFNFNLLYSFLCSLLVEKAQLKIIIFKYYEHLYLIHGQIQTKLLRLPLLIVKCHLWNYASLPLTIDENFLEFWQDFCPKAN